MAFNPPAPGFGAAYPVAQDYGARRRRRPAGVFEALPALPFADSDFRLGTTAVSHVAVLPSTRTTDYQRYVNNPDFHDVEFDVEGQPAYAHKQILAFGSIYFRTMLYGDMRESSDNGEETAIITIPNITHATFVIVLQYIYTDQVVLESLEQGELVLQAADMYQLERLTTICEEYLRQQLTEETFVSLLSMSLIHQAAGLKKCVLDYVAQNWSNPVIQAGIAAMEDLEMHKAITLHLADFKVLPPSSRSFLPPSSFGSQN